MVVATEPGSGKSVISLGLTDQFERNGTRSTFFKPVGLATARSGHIDRDVVFIHRALGLKVDRETLVAAFSDYVTHAIQEGKYDEVLDRILEAHAEVAKDADMVVCEGVDSLRAFPALDSDINVDIAKNVEAPLLLVSSARDRDVEDVVSSITLTCNGFSERGAEVLGAVVNHVDPKRHNEFADSLRRECRRCGVTVFGVLPELPELSRPRVIDVVRQCEARVLQGDKHLDTRVSTVLVAAMGLENALHYFDPNSLIIAPGDREEILLAAAAAHASPAVPRPAGVVLTGGFEPRRKVMQLVHSLSGGQLPVAQVDETTYQTAIRVDKIEPSLEEHQEDKALAIRHAMEEYVDLERLFANRVKPSRRVVTPKRFLRRLQDKARANKQTIVLPEADVDRILKAAEVLRRRDVADVVLIGDEAEVRKYAEQIDVELDDGVQIVNHFTDPAFDDYVHTLLEARKHKGLYEEAARDLMRDRTYFATMMVHKGRAHGMVSGATTTTAATVRPAFEFVRTREGIRSVSSVFFMCLPDRVLVYGDCAVVPNPTVEQLAEIALASADTAAAFDIEPRVAMLSYSTGTSGAGEDVELVREATALVKRRSPNLLVEGPIQYDAAIDPKVAQTKLPDSDVAGRATVFIFPDLNTGNNTYKAVQRSSDAIAIGPVLQGLRKPVNDLSRGATITDIVNTAIVTAVQAQSL
jgi:phosphate acetyltransferase